MKLKFKNKPVELNDLVEVAGVKVKITSDFIKANIDLFDIEEEKPKFEVGKWYISVDLQSGEIYYVNYQQEKNNYGFLGIDNDYSWHTNFYMDNFKDWKPADMDKVKELLLKKAKKDYPIGTTIGNLYLGRGKITSFEHWENRKVDSVWFSNNAIGLCVYKQGKWVEKIDTPEFEVGKWYEYNGNYILFSGMDSNLFKGSGFTKDGLWKDNIAWSTQLNEIKPADMDKVRELLAAKTKEDYPEGTKFKSETGDIFISSGRCQTFDTLISCDYHIADTRGGCLYLKGKWAVIIEKPLFKDKEGKFWYKSDFREDEVWVVETACFTFINKIDEVTDNLYLKEVVTSTVGNTFYSNKSNHYFDEIQSIRKATQEEIAWLEACRVAGKYVARPATINDFILSNSELFNNMDVVYINKILKEYEAWKQRN